MATKGQSINYANIATSAWTGSWTLTDTNRTVCLNSPCFVLKFYTHSVLLRSNWIDVTGYYYNGTSWVQAFAPRNHSGHTCYASGANDCTVWFFHNQTNEDTGRDVVADSWTSNHMWRLEITMAGGSGSAHSYFSVDYGSTGRLTEARYNTICKGQPIKCVKPVLAEIGTGFTSQITQYSTLDAFIAALRPSASRGSQILAANSSWVGATPIS